MSLPIPFELWERLRAFLADGRTGEVSLHIQAGVVRAWEIREHVRVVVLDTGTSRAVEYQPTES